MAKPPRSFEEMDMDDADVCCCGNPDPELQDINPECPIHGDDGFDGDDEGPGDESEDDDMVGFVEDVYDEVDDFDPNEDDGEDAVE